MSFIRSWWSFFLLMFGPLYVGGSKSSASSSSSTTNQSDNRVVVGNGAAYLGGFGSRLDTSSHTDSHNVAVMNDPHLDAIAQTIAATQQAVSENQGDAVRTIAKFGTDAISTQAAAATDLFATGSADATKAFGHVVDVSGELIDKLLSSATNTVAGANTVAGQAIASYQPTANAQAGAVKWGLVAAAGLAGLVLLMHFSNKKA